MDKVIYFFIALLVMYTSIITLLMLAAAWKKPKEIGEYLLVLGAKVNTDGISLSLQMRLDTAISYLLVHPQTKVIVSGGKGKDEPIEEAIAMQKYLLQHSIAKERIFIENRSTNTYENILFSMEKFQLQRIIIITNNYHLYRAKWIANRLGIKAEGLASPTPKKSLIKSYSREYAAIMNTWLTNL